jgi:hypothetical protein
MAVLPIWIKTGLSSAAFQPPASGLGLVKHEKLLVKYLRLASFSGLRQPPAFSRGLLGLRSLQFIKRSF